MKSTPFFSCLLYGSVNPLPEIRRPVLLWSLASLFSRATTEKQEGIVTVLSLLFMPRLRGRREGPP